MRIVLINENSQASKNSLIFTTLQNVAEKYGHIVKNYGMFGADDKSLTYVQNGLLAAILLNAEACDFVVTGCGTGEGAMLALNSFPKVLCGHIVDPSDAYMFNQINDGNAVAFPFAKGFGWGAELNLEYCFEKLFPTTSPFFINFFNDTSPFSFLFNSTKSFIIQINSLHKNFQDFLSSAPYLYIDLLSCFLH